VVTQQEGGLTMAKQTEGILDATNYREVAQRAIKTYEKKEMWIDGLMWSQIIGFYEEALKKAQKRED
jgi:hypothetical protein